MVERGKFWSVAETKLLLDTLSQDHIQEQLRAAVRNDAAFGKIAEVLAKRGYYRTIQQCRAKIKALQKRHRERSLTSYERMEHLFRRSLSQTSSKYTNIQTVVTDTAIFTLLSQVMNDVIGVINHDSEITRVNITRVREREPVSYPDSKPLFCAHVKRGLENLAIYISGLLFTPGKLSTQRS